MRSLLDDWNSPSTLAGSLIAMIAGEARKVSFESTTEYLVWCCWHGVDTLEFL